MNISIIIPNYNGEKILQKNLPHVLAAMKGYKDGKVEIIIPNDPSTDKSSEVIADFIKSIKDSHITGKTIENTKKEDSGFSKNVNRGVKMATGDILILFNSDVRPYKDFLAPLLAHFADEKVFAVGCMDESIEIDKTVLRGRAVGYWARGFLHHKAGDVTKTNTLWASGGSSAFRRSIWDRIGGLDNLFNPFYWEDIDLSYRALKSGYKVVFEPKSLVVHEHEEGAIKTKFKPKHIQKIAYRNQFLFIWKNITDRSLLASHVLWLPYHLLKAVGRRDFVFIKGFLLAFARMERVNHARYKAKRLFVRSDKSILKEIAK
ncbi:MAG: glycosyltransferase family 2 protein [Candidatus Levybacteria bacterium]|nr:glycosyltransferase family 2 protein [Candidatus Levybacteria bacterium]